MIRHARNNFNKDTKRPMAWRAKVESKTREYFLHATKGYRSYRKAA